MKWFEVRANGKPTTTNELLRGTACGLWHVLWPMACPVTDAVFHAPLDAL